MLSNKMVSKFARLLLFGLVAGLLGLGVATLSTSPVDAAATPTYSSQQRWVQIAVLDVSDMRTDGGTKTLTFEPLGSAMTGLTQTELMVNEATQVRLDDGGATAIVLDVGKAGALERYAKDVSLKSASGTRTLGSGTTSVKPRNFELAGVVPVATITSSVPLSRIIAGKVEIYALVENAPPMNA